MEERCRVQNCQNYVDSSKIKKFCVDHENEIKQEETYLQDMYSKICELHGLVESECKSMQDSILEICDYFNKIVENLPLTEAQKTGSEKLLKLVSPLLKNKEKLFFESKQIIKRMKKVISEPQICSFSNRLYFCRSPTATQAYSNIYYKDLLTNEQKKIRLGFKFSNKSLCCLITDEKIFLYDGNKGRGNCILYPNEIQENENITYQSVPSSEVDHYSGSFTLFKSKIYFFGGKKTILCESFDVNSHKWSDLGRLPELLISSTCVGLNNKIYICALNLSHIFEFNPETREFLRILVIGLQADQYKIIFEDDGMLFIAQGNEILKYVEENKEFQMVSTMKKKVKERIITNSVLIEDCRYYLNQNKKIVKINLSFAKLKT